MKEYAKWITFGLIAYAVIAWVSPAHSEAVKQPGAMAQKIKSAQMWAIGFGADIKQQQIRNFKTTREALHRDWSWSEGGTFTWRLKNAWEDARAQVSRDSVTVRGHWQQIAEALGGLTPTSK